MANYTLFILGGFPVRESNPGHWSQAPNRQQYMTDALTNWAKSPTLKRVDEWLLSVQFNFHVYCVLVLIWLSFVELTAANKNLEAMKKQAQSTNSEYDRLLQEHSKLQVRYTTTSVMSVAQRSFYAANWLILANFDPNFVIPEISVNQVRKKFSLYAGRFWQAFHHCLSGTYLLCLCPI